jgi:glycosyltransferase involved in cell wall biosynthesis
MARRVCIVSLTRVSEEPRVIRQSLVLRDAGWDVTVAGYRGRSPLPGWWNFIELAPAGAGKSPGAGQETLAAASRRPGFPRRVVARLSNTVRAVLAKVRQRLEREKTQARRSSAARSWTGAEAYYWNNPLNQSLQEQMRDVRADLYIGHDWYVAPLVAQLAARAGGQYSIDVHEYSREQYFYEPGSAERKAWESFDRPYIDNIQKKTLSEASVVTTVCDGIADLLQKDYGLRERPQVVRSVPAYSEQPFRAAQKDIQVLYHGLIRTTRGLDHAIRSLPMWRDEFYLTIRGPGSDEYVDELKRLAEEVGVANRVRFEQPKVFDDIVPSANLADIGYMVLDNYSPQRTFTLPNKFFEYIMAGLAICVSDLPEMAKLVRQHGVGVLVGSTDPEDIARTINSMTREKIDVFKRASLTAARTLCLEHEGGLLRERYEAALAVASKN